MKQTNSIFYENSFGSKENSLLLNNPVNNPKSIADENPLLFNASSMNDPGVTPDRSIEPNSLPNSHSNEVPLPLPK